MKHNFFAIVFVISIANIGVIFGQDWMPWRGPTHNSVSKATGLPTQWSEDKNVLWKTEIPEWGNNTPVVVGDSVFLTCHKDDGEYSLLRINKNDGKIIWQKTVGNDKTPRQNDREGFRGWQKFHLLHNLATPSVVADSKTIIAVFGNGDTAAYDWDGNQIWKHNLQKKYGEFKIWWGYGSSPLLYKELVIIAVQHDSCADIEPKFVDSYVVAFDKNTGEEKWRVLRNTGSVLESCDAFTTPVLWEHKGRTELLILGGETLDAYSPETGERFWWLNEGLESVRIVPTATPDQEIGMIFIVRGKKEPICAVAPVGDGKQPKSAISWTHAQNTPDVASLVSDGKYVYSISENGIAYCFDAKTGEIKWNKRLGGGIWYASPILADGNLFFLNMDGTAKILKASPEFELIGENKLDGRFAASIAVDGNRLLIRSNKHLYCILTHTL